MKGMAKFAALAIIFIATVSGQAIADYQVVMLGGYIPRQEGSDTGVADLDGDGTMELLVKSTGPVTEFKIYDLTTGNQEFIYQHTASEIDMIHVVESHINGAWVGLLQCIDGDTYLVYDGSLAHVLPSEDDPTKPPSLGNYPNPFQSNTRIWYRLSESGPVEITVFDVAGRVVRQFIHPEVDVGGHSFRWDGCDNAGNRLAPGTYFYSLRVNGEVQETRKAVTVY